MWLSLTWEGINELEYDVDLGGCLVWNLYVAHVDHMGWSLLARLSSLLHVLPSFFHKFFPVPRAYEKRVSNIVLHMCIFVNHLTYVVYKVDVMCGLCCTYVMCE